MKKALLALVLLAFAAAARAQEGFGENKIEYDRFDWKTYKSTHFIIYFYDKERPALQKVASYAESAYDDISRQLNFQIPKPINLIYYATHSDFEQTNTLLNFIPEGVGAFALPSRNRMVLPVDLPDEKLQQLIAHELTHVFQFEILFGGNYLRAATTNAPQWLTEGMASYFGNDEDNKDRMVLRDAVLADQVPESRQARHRRVLRVPVRPRRLRLHRRGVGQGRRPGVRLRVPQPDRRVDREGGQAAVQHLRRGLRHQVPPLPAPAVPEDPRGEGRADRLRRAVQGRRHALRRDVAARLSLRRLRRGPLDLQGRRRRHPHVDAGPQALQEPDARLHDDLRVPRLPVGDDGPAERGGHRRLARRQHGSGLRPPRAGPRPAPLERADRRHPRAGRDARPRPADQPELLADRHERRLPGAERRAGGHLLLRPQLEEHHQHHERRRLGLLAGLLAGRAVDLLLVGPRHEVEDLPVSSGHAGLARADHLRRLERRGPGALARRQAALLHLRPRPGHLQHLLDQPRDRRDADAHQRRGGRLLPDRLRREGQHGEARLLRVLQAPLHALHRRREEAVQAAARARAGSLSRRPGRRDPVPAGDRGLRRSREGRDQDLAEALPRGRAGRRRHQHRPDLRLQHHPHLRRQPGRPPVHRGRSSRSPPSRTSTSRTSISATGCRRASPSSTTGRTSSRSTSREGSTRSSATGAPTASREERGSSNTRCRATTAPKGVSVSSRGRTTSPS